VGCVAILGGTFDPVHNAHLAMGKAALAGLQPERMLWVPTGVPAYRAAPIAAASHRVAMLRLALAGEPRYAIDERELAPGASGYTFDTLSALRAQTGSATDLVLLMGADQYAALETWHRWRELLALARIAIFARPGVRIPGGDAETVPMTPMDVSASDIRARLCAGKDVSALLPAPVLDYIHLHGLYR
jgi:nicotinate-nucleotide adenylyltransferase